jgi:hypothetical protein
MEATIEKLKQLARDSWPGPSGDARADSLESFLRKMLGDYSAVLSIPEPNLLAAFERRRNYSAINYYQESNFPNLSGVVLLNDLDEFKQRYPSGKYLCPACGGESSNPYECDTGRPVNNGKPCDWKSYGLFGTMGKGMRIAFRSKFLEHGKIEEIFKPIEAVDGVQN